MRISKVTTCVLLLILSFAGRADSELPTEPAGSIEYGTAAKPLTRTAPRYPRDALRSGQEGWVILSYVVGIDGLAHDPIVEDSSGSRDFEKRALRATEDWRFEPATWKGEPVEQAQTKVRLTFALQQPQNRRGARKKYISVEKSFNRMIEEREFDAAKAFLKSTFDRPEWNLYETTRLWLLSFRLYAALADEQGQLMSIRRAAASRDFVRSDTAAMILRSKFAVEVRLSLVADALDTYDLLLAEDPSMSEDDPLAEIASNIRDIAYGDQIVSASATISASRDGCCGGVWERRLLRRIFSIDSVDGEITKVDIRCDWRRASDTDVVSGKVWEIPQSWGSCGLYVHGDGGTTFRLLEYPAEPT